MATKGVKEVEWAEVLGMAADISGAPKKQIEADQTPEQVQQMLEQDIPIDVEAK